MRADHESNRGSWNRGQIIGPKPLLKPKHIWAFRTRLQHAEHHVEATPQTFCDGKRIGGYDDLCRHLGLDVPDNNAVSYKPVVAVLATALHLHN